MAAPFDDAHPVMQSAGQTRRSLLGSGCFAKICHVKQAAGHVVATELFGGRFVHIDQNLD
jgi:hypothetical protein